MTSNRKYIAPVAPSDMTILFTYRCPVCGREYSVPEPTQPAQIRCMNCQAKFPVIPVDERTIDYIRLMLDNGRAAADADFV